MPATAVVRRKTREEYAKTKAQVLSAQEELKAGFGTASFQKELRDLNGRYETRTPAYMKERAALFMTVQGAVLPKHGFTANVAGLLKFMRLCKAFYGDRDFVRVSNEICHLLGLFEQLLPEPPEDADAKPGGAGGGPSLDGPLLKLRNLYVYYMNVSPMKSDMSEKRQRIQEDVNPLTAGTAGYLFIPCRVNAVTPDSEEWEAARREFGHLVMDSGGKDSWSDAAANCILLSFRDALRQAMKDTKGLNPPAFVVITEDDMMLSTGFHVPLEAAAVELLQDSTALGAMLHSTSLEENMLQSCARSPALFPVWPRYPLKPVLKKRHSTTWPGCPVIPDQPLVALLKSAKLKELAEMYEDRLRYSGWSPLDWILANTPFGESGKLRLTARNGFCRGAGNLMGSGSVRCEQHQVSSGSGADEKLGKPAGPVPPPGSREGLVRHLQTLQGRSEGRQFGSVMREQAAAEPELSEARS